MGVGVRAGGSNEIIYSSISRKKGIDYIFTTHRVVYNTVRIP